MLEGSRLILKRRRSTEMCWGESRLSQGTETEADGMGSLSVGFWLKDQVFLLLALTEVLLSCLRVWM